MTKVIIQPKEKLCITDDGLENLLAEWGSSFSNLVKNSHIMDIYNNLVEVWYHIYTFYILLLIWDVFGFLSRRLLGTILRLHTERKFWR